MSKIEAVLFDKDGTLFDFQKTWGPWAATFVRSLAEGDIDRLTLICDVLGFDLEQGVFRSDSMSISCTPDEQVAALRPILTHLDDAGIRAKFESVDEKAIPVLVDGMPELLQMLSARGVQMGVVTNDFEAGAQQQLENVGINDAFKVIIGFDSGHGGKPAPHGCLAGAKALGCAPERTVMIGDSLHDLNAGRAAGMKTIAVLTGTATAEDLAPFADLVLPSVSELRAYL